MPAPPAPPAPAQRENAVPVLALDRVDKHFGPTHAVKALDLALLPASVHALVGENGAGKSTAAQIAAGVHRASSGVVRIDGVPRELRSARVAELDGVVLIPQELLLYDSLTIEDNLFAGRPRPRSRGLVDIRALHEQAERALERLGLSLDRRQRVGALAPGVKQMVAIARALVHQARVLVMDEPTAALDEWEAQRLLTVVDGLRAEGVAVLYVSHRLNEVMSIADEVTVLRDGAKVAEGPVAEFDQQRLVELMVGREVLARERNVRRAQDAVALEVRGLGRAGEFDNIDLAVSRGEVLGLAGIVGAGRSEVGQTIFGIRSADRGTIAVNGRQLSGHGVRQAVAAGLAYVPEERQSQGLVLDFTVRDNVALSSLSAVTSKGLIGSGRVEAFAAGALRGLRLKGATTDKVRRLSGGNQQKVLLGKWLATKPAVVVLDEPTRGIDVGARAEIYALVDRLAEQGCALLLISSDLQELLLLCDRIAVMRDGRLVAEFDESTMSEVAVGSAALGADDRQPAPGPGVAVAPEQRTSDA